MGSAAPAGTNAREQRRHGRFTSAFVPVIAITDPAPAPASMHSVRVQPEQQSSHLSSRSPTSAWLSAQLPNGVKLELECSERDAALVSAMIAALGRR